MPVSVLAFAAEEKSGCLGFAEPAAGRLGMTICALCGDKEAARAELTAGQLLQPFRVASAFHLDLRGGVLDFTEVVGREVD
jgi:hypothetical protein